jgi:hypothetical protein
MTSLIRFADADENPCNADVPDHTDSIESIRIRLTRNWQADSVETRLALLATLVYLTHQQSMNQHRK